jgi:thymidylate kinase
MIIVEGTDKSGKSTFIANLLQAFPENYKEKLRMAHFGILPDDWDYSDDYIGFIGPNVILDRFIDSERAYGPLYRGGVNPKLTTKNMLKVYGECAKIGTLLVYCNPDLEEVQKRIERMSDEMVKNQEQLIKLRGSFDSVFTENYPLEVITVDTSKPIKPEVYEKIVNRSLLLSRFAETIKSLNYRGFLTPYSKRIIYASKTCLLANVQEEIARSSKLPFTEFGIVYSRGITNELVNLNALNLEMNIQHPVVVFGKDAEEDYIAAGNCLPKANFLDAENLKFHLMS